MAKLLFLIIVFIVSVALSFYFSAEGFEAVNTNALESELVELNKTIDYLKSLGINEGSQNETYDKSAARIKEINNSLALSSGATAADISKGELQSELVELNKTIDYLKSLGINEGSQNETYDKTAARIKEINGILTPVPMIASAPMIPSVPIPSQAAPLVDSSGIQVPAPGVTTDASGNVISNRLKDLISILTQPPISVAAANVAAEEQARKSVPAPSSDNSGNAISLASFYETIKPQIQKDVSQAVRQEFERTTVLPKKEQRRVATPSVAQGVSWPSYPGGGGDSGNQYPQPDMSEYIRKDSIPCWACDVKY